MLMHCRSWKRDSRAKKIWKDVLSDGIMPVSTISSGVYAPESHSDELLGPRYSRA